MRAILFGDLHFDDRYKDSHIDYSETASKMLATLTEIINKEKPDCVVLSGDLIGNGKVKVVQYRSSLKLLFSTLRAWGVAAKKGVYSLVGNHDIGGSTTDFEVAESAGLISTPKWIDLSKGCRLHLFNYGEVTRKVSLKKGGTNIGFCHDALNATTQTAWVKRYSNVFELPSLVNLEGISVMFAGHVHLPSSQYAIASVGDTDCKLFYLGAPIRTDRNSTYDKAYYAVIDAQDDNVDIEVKAIPLCPLDEEFAPLLEGYEPDSITEIGKVNIQELAAVLSEIQSYNIASTDDAKSQIARYCGEDSEAKELANAYFDKAIEEVYIEKAKTGRKTSGK